MSTRKNKSADIVAIKAAVTETLASITNPAIAVEAIKPVHPQQIGEIVASMGRLSLRLTQYCKANLKGFPEKVTEADKASICTGIQKYKNEYDKEKGRDFQVIKLSDKRYVRRDEWLEAHGSNPDAAEEILETIEITGAYVCSLSGAKIRTLPEDLNKLVTARKTPIMKYVADTYRDFIARAIRDLENAESLAKLESGKTPKDNKRPLLGMDVRLAKLFFRAIKAAEDGTLGNCDKETVEEAIEEFWEKVGLTAPELDAKGQPIVEKKGRKAA